MRSGFLTALVAALILLVAVMPGQLLAANGATYQFTARQGYFNGGTLHYLLTDVTDQSVAQTLLVNYTPLLRNALYNPYLPVIYQVTNNPQNWVFSAQWTSFFGATSYMPVWVLYNVTWYSGKPKTLLKSAADVNAARAAGRVSVRAHIDVTHTTTVIGASIVVNTAGTCIKQGSYVLQGGFANVTLPVSAIFVNNTTYRVLNLDFSNRGEALAYAGNYCPNMAQFNPQRMKGLPAAWQSFYNLWSPSPGQFPVARELPAPWGWGNANANYSPLMNEYNVRTLTSPPPLYTSYAQIVADSLPASASVYFSYHPILEP